MGGYANFGNKSQIRSSVTTNSSLPLNSNFDSLNAVVKQVITTDNPDPILDPITGEKYTQLGTILAESIFANTTGRKYIATPKSSYVINIPTINEIVTLYPLPTNNNPGRAWQYGSPISTFGISSVNNNISFPTDIVPPTQTSVKDYRMAEFGIPKNTIPQKQPKIFTERIISPLTQNSGDITYMGRYGQSLRFGNNSGDPITIIRNGQSTQGGDPWTPISENISKDPSSLYLTTTQKLPFALANENFNSYSTPPITPSTYTLPQAILISDRIVLNAKTDSVLISGHKSVGISSNDSVNIESLNKLYLHSNDIRLGPNPASSFESALLGDTTVTLLTQLCIALKSMADVMEVSQIFPGGVPVPDPTGNIVGSNASTVIQTIIDNLGKIKSNYIKLK
jgi:hypothetical protein